MEKLTLENYRDLTQKASEYQLINDRALILLGDSATILKDTPCHFDRCISDPPYEFDAAGGKSRFGNKVNSFEVMRSKGLADGFDENIIREIAKTADSVILFHHNDQDYAITGLLTQPYSELDFIDDEATPLVNISRPALYDRFVKCQWRKTNPMPVANKHYVPETEPWIHAWRAGKFAPGGELSEKMRIIDAPVGKSDYDHPTVKPLKVMRKCIINGSNKGDVIIDPFAGTSSTGVAALQLGRLYIGIEKDPEYYEISVKRLRGCLAAFETGDIEENQFILI